METLKETQFVAALLPLVAVIFIIGVAVVLLYQHFQKNLFIQKLKQEELRNAYQNDLLRSNIQAQEEERKRIAHDLHDELGAVLSIMQMNMLLLEQQNKDVPGTLLPGLEQVRQLSETALTSVRSISHKLMPPQLEAFGLIKTLESVTEQINNTGNLSIQLDVSTPHTDFSWAINLGLYRIVMELINNTIKHAGATEAEIKMYMQGRHIICQYTDNGKGLGNDHISKGLGHKSIDGRIHALGGTFDFGTQTDGGFFATIRVPYANNAIN